MRSLGVKALVKCVETSREDRAMSKSIMSASFVVFFFAGNVQFPRANTLERNEVSDHHHPAILALRGALSSSYIVVDKALLTNL